MKKICTGCKLNKELIEFSPRKDGVLGRASRCKICRRNDRELNYKDSQNEFRRKRWEHDEEYRAISLRASKNYRIKNRHKINLKLKESRNYKRRQVISRYGGKCECCSEMTYEFLAIDHKFGGGTQQRKEISANKLIEMLYNNTELDINYRILCHNCNMCIGIYGKCAHSITEIQS